MANNQHYDVGIYGLWYGNNYGSMVTYYALSKIMEKMGKTYAMLRNPLGREIDVNTLRRSHPLRFGFAHYAITKQLPLSRMAEHNQSFDAFLLGSDQMWNYHLSRPYQQSYFFDFVQDDKISVAYATSFGKDQYIGPDEEKTVTKSNLKRFHAISVRDDFSKRICEQDFDVPAELVLDPVFLCEKSNYETLIAESDFHIDEPYLFAYILDPNPELGAALQNAAEKTNLPVYVVFNESSDKQKCKEALRVSDERIRYLEEPTLQEWLYLFRNCRFVLTDSFHGSCFSIIFEKTFIVLKNNGRGGQRFPYLLGTMGLLDYMVESPAQMREKFNQLGVGHVIDYAAVRERIEPEIRRSFQWLDDAINNRIHHEHQSSGEFSMSVPAPKAAPAPVPEKLHPDIERCKMVVSMLRDYGIRHIVVSSGARDVSLVRFFEYNKKDFITHNVTDERSAAYYALGLATRLKEPVAITCTSGTAVSNYLPGITEAFYMQVPIAVISGDRYPCFLHQMEAQKIDHLGALASVVKASVELPINWDGMGQWEARRKISEALLEMTHHGAGPVHINVPMNYLQNTFPKEEELALGEYRHIDRVEYESPAQVWDTALQTLKNARRILIISGQANPMSPEEKRNFDLFCEKFNCVVVTDHLSNVHNDYTVNPFNLMRKTNKDYFIRNFNPDLILYFGGKRVLNCPLQGKLRSIPRKFQFWRIDRDGKVADLYRLLTHVFEMSPDYFFRYFAEHAGDIHNDGNYLKVWKEQNEAIGKINYRETEGFTSFYSIGATMSVMPRNSILHLGVGTSFNRAHYYELDDSITVYCNMGTNGIDGSASTFMGQACVSDELCFLFIGDLSFFYDMNSVWNKPMKGNIRILMNNDGGAGFLRHFATGGITQAHQAVAKGWVESLGFRYLCAHNREEFDALLPEFVAEQSDKPIFFEVMISPQD